MFETYGIYVLAGGMFLILLGYLWLLVRAWRLDWRWGLALIAFPVVLPIFLVLEIKRVTVPATVLMLGLLLAGGTIGLNLYLAHHIDLGPREKIVDGQRHVTLTGWDKSAEDYAALEARPDTVVLQMANRDVTDATLGYLAGWTKLEEIDLNDTQITDAGLAKLARLPRLRVLRIRGAKVTDQGFRDLLLEKESLTELDARETEIASKTLRQWKNAKKELRRYMK